MAHLAFAMHNATLTDDDDDDDGPDLQLMSTVASNSDLSASTHWPLQCTNHLSAMKGVTGSNPGVMSIICLFC